MMSNVLIKQGRPHAHDDRRRLLIEAQH